MKPARKRRLWWLLSSLLGIALSMTLLLLGLGEHLNQYYELTDVAAGKAPVDRVIRLGGIVRQGSIKLHSGTLDMRFVITDYYHDVSVDYTGIVPDLFREGQGVLVKGRFQADQVFLATQILTKHDENYMPKEVYDSLKKQGIELQPKILEPSLKRQ